MRSPDRSVINETLDPEVSRALARELYIEETVNVVNPGKRGSPGKVKPGQMNLFNPAGQKNLEISYGGGSPGRTNRSFLGSVQNILASDGPDRVRMRNADLQKKTEEVQNEFDQLMNEMNQRRNAGMGLTNP